MSIAIDIENKRIIFKGGMTDQEKYIALKKLWKNSDVLPAYPFPVRADRYLATNEVYIYQNDFFWTIEKDKINGQIIDKVPK